ncbi:MAG: polyribonucleotide nucleotidyltransferase [Anaerolineae bacterium]|jgi:polyribonucleotide nucleotidyltransferase|nr:polyribonucleotide nucleotidyltransferase [Anaerolineae bacterium]
MVDSAYRPAKRFSVMVGGQEFILETGKLAEQAGGAVTAQFGDTIVFAAATMSKNMREGIDFFPLSVDYEEKLYAAGRIPGSYFRREGRPPESAILVSRVIDRPLRPLFPEDLRNEVQVILMPLAHDQDHQIDMLGILAASAALTISDVPFDGPVAGVRIGCIDGELVVNPTISQLANSTLDLRVAGTADAINMVECAAHELDEATMLQALALAHQSIQPLIELQLRMREATGKPKSSYTPAPANATLREELSAKARPQLREILTTTTDRSGRKEAVDAVKDALRAEYDARNKALAEGEAPFSMKEIGQIVEDLLAEEVRQRIVNEGVRPDGRNTTEIRPLAAEVGLFPRVHGTGLFTRGQTQVLSIATLGTPGDAQELDSVAPEADKRYMHHYNFPPYSTGEAYPLRGTKRREIGHGALAEAALRSMIPDEDVFPYTIRVVSEVMSSNGSTSMASVCGSTLALMDAGVPLKRPVAGIAMGLIKEGDKVAVLTDIQGLEDHIGDMDFKVAGTERGITALQMDIKIKGVTHAVMTQALAQAKDARMQILEVMLATLPEPRAKLSDYAPRMETLKIDVEKIGTVIGPGGKMIRALQERFGVKIDIQDDGTVFVSGQNGAAVEKCVDEIRGMTESAVLGRVYTGKVTRIEAYGCFVEFLPSREGLVHISQLADYRVGKVEDEVALGDEIMVMVTDIDPGGKVRLSRRAVMEGLTLEEAQEMDKRPSGGGGGDRGGRGGGDRGGDRRGGGDRDRRGGGGYRG